jgi:hypothetical protein
MKSQYSQKSATGYVKQGISAYHGYIVVTTTATAAILIRDGVSGLVIDTLPIGTAAGAVHTLTAPVATNNGLYFDLNGGTGTVNVLYE